MPDKFAKVIFSLSKINANIGAKSGMVDTITDAKVASTMVSPKVSPI